MIHPSNRHAFRREAVAHPPRQLRIGVLVEIAASDAGLVGHHDDRPTPHFGPKTGKLEDAGNEFKLLGPMDEPVVHVDDAVPVEKKSAAVHHGLNYEIAASLERCEEVPSGYAEQCRSRHKWLANGLPKGIGHTMNFTANNSLREEMLAACRVLTHFRIVEGFGHVSARIGGAERLLMTPRHALGLVTEAELIEIDLEGHQWAGDGTPPLELSMHLAIYRRRADVKAIVRGHPRHIAAYACAGEPLLIAHGF